MGGESPRSSSQSRFTRRVSNPFKSKDRGKDSLASVASRVSSEHQLRRSGTIQFPGSVHAPSQWIRAQTEEPAALLSLFRKSCAVSPPGAVISIEGTMVEGSSALQEAPLQIFQRGLASAASMTNAWVRRHMNSTPTGTAPYTGRHCALAGDH